MRHRDVAAREPALRRGRDLTERVVLQHAHHERAERTRDRTAGRTLDRAFVHDRAFAAGHAEQRTGRERDADRGERTLLDVPSEIELLAKLVDLAANVGEAAIDLVDACDEV